MKQLPPVVAILLASLTALGMFIPTVGNAEEPVAISATAETPHFLFAGGNPQIKLEVVNPPDDWERFIAEFGLDHEPSRLVLNSIADAKYGVDVTLFSMTELANRLTHLLEIRYSHGHFNYGHEVKLSPPQLARHGPFFIEDTRIKFDYDFTGGKPYAGFRVVIPFGH